MTPRVAIQAAAAALALAGAMPAQALVYLDDTTDSPTFNRALADFSGLDPVGTGVAYDVFAFSVGTSGTYSFNSIALGGGGHGKWNQFLYLYGDGFDPAAPTVNGLIANDDFKKGPGRSGFKILLDPGVAYYLVTAGYDDTESGRYVTQVRGPGPILPVVPEPDTYAMLAMGLLGVAVAVRRRRGKQDS